MCDVLQKWIRSNYLKFYFIQFYSIEPNWIYLILSLEIATYGVAIGYCVTDVAYEAYKLRDRGYVTEDGRHVTMTQVTYVVCNVTMYYVMRPN